MIRFTCRTDLVLWLHDHIYPPSAQEAVYMGEVELLGGFSRIPPGDRPGWVVRVKSNRGSERLWVIMLDDRREPYAWTTLEVPWQYYAGQVGRGSIYDGDHPEKYLGLKNAILANDRHIETGR